MDGVFADNGSMLLLVSDTSAVVAVDAGIAMMFTKLAAAASLVASPWVDSSLNTVIRFFWCPTLALCWQPMLASPRCLMSWQPLPV